MAKSTEDLTYGQIIFKASHNSYAQSLKESIAQQLTFNKDEPYNCGCMALELDIYRHTSDCLVNKKIEEGLFTVSHNNVAGMDSLKIYLDKIKAWHEIWHEKNPKHHVVLITMDIKSQAGGYDSFHDQIDTYLKVYFGEDLIYKPGELNDLPGNSLCEKITRNGWKELETMQGKFIFCLSGNKEWKSEYTRHDLLTKRLCFSDLDKPDNDSNVSPPDTGNIVFFNFHIFRKNRGVWMNTIPAFARRNLIVRAYTANSEDNWKSCMDSNVSVIATDKVSDHKWAKVSDTDYLKKKTPVEDKRSLKNKKNGEFRTDKATQMRDTFLSPNCVFILEKQDDENTYAIRNARNSEYLDCSITTMASKIDGDCQRWEVIAKNVDKNEYYIKNKKNGKYLTKKASQLHDGKPGDDEIYILASEE